MTTSDEELSYVSSIRFTVFNVLKAFINESILANEADFGLLEKLTEEVRTDISPYPENIIVYRFKVYAVPDEYFIAVTHDFCGDIDEIYEVLESKKPYKPIIPTIEWVCRIIGAEEESCNELLIKNAEMARKMFKKLYSYRKENSLRLNWERNSSFILLEQKYNVDRPKMNPISHAFMGNEEHHPFLMDKSWVEIPIFSSKSNKIEYSNVSALRNDPSYSTYMDLYGTKGCIPLHPYSVDYLKVNHPILMSDLKFEETIRCYPTTSIRTLLHVNENDSKNDFQIKCSYTAQITSHSRVLNKEEAINGIRTTEVFMQLLSKGLWPEGVYFIPEICMMSHTENSIVSCLLRGGLNSVYPKLKDSEILIPSFSLFSPSPTSKRSIYEELLEKSGSTVHGFFMETAKALIHSYLGLVKYGLGHESHAQNTLIVWDNEQKTISGVCFRDIESTKITKKFLEKFDVNSHHINADNARETRSMAVLEDHDVETRKYFLTSMYTHGIIDSQLNYIVKLLSERYQQNEDMLINLCRNIYIEWWSQNSFSFTEYCDLMSNLSTRKNLLSKGLGLKSTPVPYRKVLYNPFYPDYKEIEHALIKH